MLSKAKRQQYEQRLKHHSSKLCAQLWQRCAALVCLSVLLCMQLALACTSQRTTYA